MSYHFVIPFQVCALCGSTYFQCNTDHAHPLKQRTQIVFFLNVIIENGTFQQSLFYLLALILFTFAPKYVCCIWAVGITVNVSMVDKILKVLVLLTLKLPKTDCKFQLNEINLQLLWARIMRISIKNNTEWVPELDWRTRLHTKYCSRDSTAVHLCLSHLPK